MRTASSPRSRAGLANSVRKECKAAGIVDTSANLWKFYVNKCRNNLHLGIGDVAVGRQAATELQIVPRIDLELRDRLVLRLALTQCGNQRVDSRDAITVILVSHLTMGDVSRAGRPTLYRK